MKKLTHYKQAQLMHSKEKMTQYSRDSKGILFEDCSRYGNSPLPVFGSLYADTLMDFVVATNNILTTTIHHSAYKIRKSQWRVSAYKVFKLVDRIIGQCNDNNFVHGEEYSISVYRDIH